jgi:hypothetical protein
MILSRIQFENNSFILDKINEEARQYANFKNPFSVLFIKASCTTCSETDHAVLLHKMFFEPFEQIFTAHFREIDSIGFFNNDTVAILLPDTSQDGARIAAQKIQDLVSENLTTISEQIWTLITSYEQYSGQKVPDFLNQLEVNLQNQD